MSKDISPNCFKSDGLAASVNDRPPLALIAGPTASGKSDCAVALAQAVEKCGRQAVVINADSAQVYADLQIVSARPSMDDMKGIEHRLFGTWDGAVACSAADWAAAARVEISHAHAKGALPILVGGTGLYMRTLLDGIAPVPAIDPEVRAQIRALPVAQAYAALSTEDPERAAKLGPADAARISRALEVIRSTGTSLAQWQSKTEGGIGDAISLKAAILLPDRDVLYARCDSRFARMMVDGGVEEVKRLLDRNLDPTLPVMRAIGVAEIASAVRGDLSTAAAILQGAQSTRNYAKRQYTWFRNQPPEKWTRLQLDPFTSQAPREILLRKFGLT